MAKYRKKPIEVEAEVYKPGMEDGTDDRFLFRAWDKQDKKMIKIDSINFKGFTLNSFIAPPLLITSPDGCINQIIKLSEVVLMQSTGIRDKNGELIFEGDIVRCVSQIDTGNMVVIFEDGEFRMVLCENYKNYSNGMGYYGVRHFTKEIIGNIWDNPELLEAGK